MSRKPNINDIIYRLTVDAARLYGLSMNAQQREQALVVINEIDKLVKLFPLPRQMLTEIDDNEFDNSGM